MMATYVEIRECVRARHGRYVKDCWIAHVKELNGLPVKMSPNRMSPRKCPCPDRVRPMIEDAMRHLGMLSERTGSP